MWQNFAQSAPFLSIPLCWVLKSTALLLEELEILAAEEKHMKLSLLIVF